MAGVRQQVLIEIEALVYITTHLHLVRCQAAYKNGLHFK